MRSATARLSPRTSTYCRVRALTDLHSKTAQAKTESSAPSVVCDSLQPAGVSCWNHDPIGSLVRPNDLQDQVLLTRRPARFLGTGLLRASLDSDRRHQSHRLAGTPRPRWLESRSRQVCRPDLSGRSWRQAITTDPLVSQRGSELAALPRQAADVYPATTYEVEPQCGQTRVAAG